MVAAVAPKQIINSLKSVVSSVYKEGVDQILSWPQIDVRGYLSFRFRGGKQVYDCEISPDGIIGYVEAQRSDSVLLGAYFGPIAQYIEDSDYADGLLVSEITRLDGKKCRIGKSCGNSCITVNAKCSQMLGLKQKQAINNIREAVSQKAKPDNTGRNLAIAAGIGATVLAGGAIAGGVMLFGGRGAGEQGGTSSVNPPSPTNPPEPDVPSPPRSRNMTPSSAAGALSPGKPPTPPRERRKNPIAEQPQNPVIVTPPPIPQGKFSDGAIGKIETAASAIKKTFSKELQDAHQLQVLPKKAPDKGVKEAIGEGLNASRGALSVGLAGANAADLVDGSLDNLPANVARAGAGALASGVTKAVQSLKKPSAKDLAPSVDMISKVIHVSEASPHADIDTMRGLGQYLHNLGTQDPKKAQKLNKFIDGLLTSSACRRLQNTASTAKSNQARDDANFELQREQVFGRAIAQFTINKQKMKAQQKELTNRAKTKGTHWNKEEFGRIEQDMDKLFKEFGWT